MNTPAQIHPHRDSPILETIVFGESIPALPAGVPELLKDLTNDEIGFHELTDKLIQFPSITSRLLFLANSSWSSPLVPIDSLDLACAKLGLSVIRTVSLALSIAAPFNPTKCPGFDSHRFWLNALMTADAARLLCASCQQVQTGQKSALHTAGVLHNIGMLWLADRYPADLSEAIQRSLDREDQSLRESIQEVFGLSYTDVNQQLAQQWGFPPMLVTVLAEHNNTAFAGEFMDQAHCIGLGTRLVDCLAENSVLTLPELLTDPRTAKLGFNEFSMAQVLDNLQQKQESTSALVSSYLSSE